MKRLVKNQTLKIKGNYISESEVFDDENHKTYYVVVRLGNLLYATFDGSYIEYLKGNQIEPNMIEGNSYLWFDLFEDRGETPFREFYYDCLGEASLLEKKEFVKRKYSHLKKPLGNIKYEVVYRKKKTTYGCGPMGEAYEIKFHILDDDTFLYIYANDWCFYCLTNKPSEEDDPNSVIEYFEGFEHAKKSKYYDLYLEMEKYIDGIE